MINIVILLAITALFTMALALRFTVFAKPTGTYETTVIDKREQNTVIYTGVFIPLKQLILETTELHRIHVRKQVYDRIKIGDRVTVTRYSNGSRRLQV
jgi:hypothetical protein